MNQNNFLVTEDLYATKTNRFINYFIDIIAIIVVLMAIMFVATYIYYSIAEDTSIVDNLLSEEEDVNPILDRLITGIVMAMLYFALEFFTKGRSFGKYVTKTKVVMEDGSLPEAMDYLKRSFSRIIPFDALSFLGSTGRGWHDTISKTYVVDMYKFEAKKRSHSELDQIGVAQDL